MSKHKIGDRVVILPGEVGNAGYEEFEPGDVGEVTYVDHQDWVRVRVLKRFQDFFAMPSEVGSADDPEWILQVQEAMVAEVHES